MNVASQKRTLSEREREILTLLSDGKTSKEIAHHLGISSWTIRTHMERIRAKLNAQTTVEAMHLATEEGVIG